jgi:hypothetical protein
MLMLSLYGYDPISTVFLTIPISNRAVIFRMQVTTKSTKGDNNSGSKLPTVPGLVVELAVL